ncbi:hypothetical protein KUTeg_014758 [Tegillarca granosa]|uniref:FAS1 domain-containing protein n=1 Tax=Tegillarca granosa TaxID=220873 RepID=A0ABQ9EVG7_TEGGR|nr:hypothetical protein KUTeg_014758 [Tegillarca granosa]
MGRVNRSFVLVIFIVLFTEFCIAQDQDIKQTLENNGNFTRFLQILRKAQLDQEFAGSRTKLTLFAFQNSAYDQLSLERRRKIDQLSQIDAQTFIRAHTMFKREFQLDNINGAYLEDKSMNGRPLYFSKKTESNFNFQGTFGATLYYVNGAQINNHYKNKYCRNGYLHGLLDVMHVPIADSAYMYLSQDNKDGVNEPTRLFKKLVDSLTLSYYDPVLAMQKIDTTLTLFVPSDKAMSKIPSTYRDRLEREEETLYKVVYAHIIPGQAVFTEPTVHNHGFRDGYPAGSNTKDNRVIIRKPNLDHVYVNSLRVTAEITNGNLTCRNGVVHIIDKLLGYVFYSVREEISKYARQFDQIINRANPDIVKGLTEQSQTTVFVPTDEAFQNIANLPWIDLNTMNQNITNMN